MDVALSIVGGIYEEQNTYFISAGGDVINRYSGWDCLSGS